MAIGTIVISLLASGLSATAGVLISLRASTARQAAQTMGIAMMVLVFVPILGLQAPPAERRDRLIQSMSGSGFDQTLLWAAVVVALLDTLLLAAGMARFNRAKLILD